MPKVCNLKKMIEETLLAKGGSQYLMQQADENPKAFLTLLKYIAPKEGGTDLKPFEVEIDGEENRE